MDVAVAFIQSMRAMAIIAGVLVLFDSLKIYAGVERPPHNPQRNAVGWALLAFTAALGGSGLIYFGQPTVGGQDGMWPNLVVAFIWSGWATGLVYRASVRAQRGWMIWAAMAIIVGAGTILQTAS